jgi:hypothetical protein
MGGRRRRKLSGDPLARYCQCGHTRAMHGKHACTACDCPLYRGPRAIPWTRILGFNLAQVAQPWSSVLGWNFRNVGSMLANIREGDPMTRPPRHLLVFSDA